MVDLNDVVCGCEPTVSVNMRYHIYRQNKDMHAGKSYQKHLLGVGKKRRKKGRNKRNNTAQNTLLRCNC